MTYPRPSTDQRGGVAQAVIAWIATVCTLGYFLPWAVAATRGKSNSLAIGLLNFLAGWTVIGWIIALVMACSAHQVVNTTVVNAGGYGYPAPGPQFGQP